MTAQEILEGITRRRAEPVTFTGFPPAPMGPDLQRKLVEIEWALQAIAEWMVEHEQALKGIDQRLTFIDSYDPLAR